MSKRGVEGPWVSVDQPPPPTSMPGAGECPGKESPREARGKALRQEQGVVQVEDHHPCHVTPAPPHTGPISLRRQGVVTLEDHSLSRHVTGSPPQQQVLNLWEGVRMSCSLGSPSRGSSTKRFMVSLRQLNLGTYSMGSMASEAFFLQLCSLKWQLKGPGRGPLEDHCGDVTGVPLFPLSKFLMGRGSYLSLEMKHPAFHVVTGVRRSSQKKFSLSVGSSWGKWDP